MTKNQKERLGDALKKLKECKKVIAKERDKMREIVEEYTDILDTSDNALRDINAAIDELSQYL